MKKYIAILFIGLFCFSLVIDAQTKSFKRGIGVNNPTAKDIEALAPGTSWVYNWGHNIPNFDAALRNNNIVFIPMAWNGINKTTARNLLKDRPEIKYILGFNEPNFTDQAHMTPQQCADRWKDIEEIADEFGLITVGPALNYGSYIIGDPVKWYEEFFRICPTCRVDHIAVHAYMSSIDGFVNSFKKFGKPIWLTEFCEWSTNTNAASQRKMMIKAFDFLEQEPMVHRYAWFKEKGWNGGHPYMQLLDENNGNNGNGVLTELGEIFVNMSSYDNNFYHSIEAQIQSEHYIKMNRIDMEKTTDVNGKINLFSMGTASWVDYNVNIPTAGEYTIFFRISAEFGDDTEVYVAEGGKDNGAVIATKLFEKKGVNVWNTQSVKGTFAAGKQKIRVGFKKGGLRLNWWGISKRDISPSGIETIAVSNDVAIGPNPVKDILNIQTSGNSNEVSLFDISGKCIYFGKNVKEIPMSDFAQGLYMLDVRAENGERVVEKILKEN